MPPPSSPQQNVHAPFNGQRGPPSSFGTGRELPGLGSGARSGMSISSIVSGGDSGAPSNSLQHSPANAATAHSPLSRGMQPPSPRRGPPPGLERYPAGPTSRFPDAPGSYPAHSPPHAHSSKSSPEQNRQSLAQLSQQFRPNTSQGPRPYQSLSDPFDREIARSVSNGVPQRPNSQPVAATGVAPPPPGGRDAGAVHEYGGHPYEPSSIEQRRGPEHFNPERGMRYDHRRPEAESLYGRDRPNTTQKSGAPMYGPPPQHYGPHPEPHREQAWRADEMRGSSEQLRRSDARDGAGSVLSSPLSNRNNAPSQAAHSTPLVDASPRMQSYADMAERRQTELHTAPPTSDPFQSERRPMEDPQQRAASYDGQMRKNADELHRQRPFFGISPDANRKLGRNSPMPQAVQGAQSQPSGPARNPSIKDEFGRMFSGIGTPMARQSSGNGALTPTRGSPMPPDSAPVSGSFESDGFRMARVGSHQGRRQRLIDDSRLDSDGGEGRGTPGTTGERNSKRAKSSHPGHHHHHHAPHSHQ